MNVFDCVTRRPLDEEKKLYQSSSTAVILSVILLLCVFLTGMIHMTIATRMCYALARDNGLPGSSWLKVIDANTNNPERVVLVIFVV